MAVIRPTKPLVTSSKKRGRAALVNGVSKRPRVGKLRVQNTLLSPFGGVSQVQQAPVSIGNSLRSCAPLVMTNNDSTSVTGRDFVMSLQGVSSGMSTWALSGGVPLTPGALVASVLRGYYQSHESYRFRRLQLHYISSSPTSLSGDVLMLYHTNRGGPKVNHNSSNFLSYALSTQNAMLGPQWNNMSVNIECSKDWVSTDIFNSEDVQHQSDGEVLVYTRNTSNGTLPDSPGYLIIDYIVDFKHLMTNPRLLTLPSSLLKWFNIGVAANNITVIAGAPVVFTSFNNSTYTANTSIAPPGDVAGNVYQIVLDTDFAFFNPNGLNRDTMWSTRTDDATARVAYPFATGTTIYAVSGPLPVCTIYPTYDAAMSGRPLVWSVGFSGVSLGLNAVYSCVGSVTPNFLQANIG